NEPTQGLWIAEESAVGVPAKSNVTAEIKHVRAVFECSSQPYKQRVIAGVESPDFLPRGQHRGIRMIRDELLVVTKRLSSWTNRRRIFEGLENSTVCLQLPRKTPEMPVKIPKDR